MNRLAVLLLALLLPCSARPQTFQWQHPLPTGNDLRCAAVLPGGIRLLAGDAGTFVRSVNGGVSWDLLSPELAAGDVTDITFPDDSIGYACTSMGMVLKTTDAGGTWVSCGTPAAVSLQSVDFLNADTGMAVGASSTILRTTDGGATWSVAALPTATTLYRIRYADAATAYVGTPSATLGRLLRTTDGGGSWQAAGGYSGTGAVRGISFPCADSGWVCTALYEIYRTTNGGGSFELQADPGTGILSDIIFLSSQKGAAAGARGEVFVTTDGGTHWVMSPMGYSSSLYGAAMGDSPAVLTVAGAGGSFASSTDDGVSWAVHTQALTRYDLRAVQFLDDNVGFAAGGSSTVADSTGVLLKTVNGGRTWTLLPFNPGHRIYSAFWVDADTGFVASIGPSGMWKTTDGGQSFFRIPHGMGVESSIWYTVRFLNGRVGYVAGSAGLLARTTDGGTTWIEQTSGHGLSAIYHLFLIDQNHAVTTGGSGRVYATSNGGVSWYPIGIGGSNTVYSSWWHNPDTGFVSGSGGLIRMTTNGGMSWTPESVNTTASLYRIVFTDSRNGWACGSLGSVFRTTDGGTIWEPATRGISASKTLYDLDARAGGLRTVGTDAVILFADLSPVSAGAAPGELPPGPRLLQNYPNPFNAATVIPFETARDGIVTLRVYDLLGREAAALVDGPLPAGSHTVRFEAAGLSSGVYFYRLHAGGGTLVKRMVMVR